MTYNNRERCPACGRGFAPDPTTGRGRECPGCSRIWDISEVMINA